MKITVLNGSPKGELSGTLKYIEFLKIKYPNIDFTVFHISKRMPAIAGKGAEYQKILDSIEKADAIIWCFPLYFYLVHSELKRFIEFIAENHDEAVFANKYAAAISTSIHFFDHTAHAYIQGISEDFGMRFYDSYSPAMFDFLKQSSRHQFLFFADRFFACIREQRPIARQTNVISHISCAYNPATVHKKVNAGKKRVIVIADHLEKGNTVSSMVQRFSQSINGDVEIVDLSKMRISGGCLGCIKCGWDNTCRYEGKDDYIDFYKKSFMKADIIVIAGKIKGRFLSWEWKRFMDRSFWRTHSPSFNGQQVGLLVSGPLSQLPNVMNVFYGHFEVGHANLLGFVSDESNDSIVIDDQITCLAKDLVDASNYGYKKPVMFPGYAGMKVFRDEIYCDLKAFFRADFKYYRKNKIFNFPQKKRFNRFLGSLFILVMKIRPLRKMFTNMIKEGIVMPHNKILKNESLEQS